MRLFDSVLALRAGIVKDNTVDSVHGRLVRVVFRLNKALDSAIVDKIFPIIHFMEHIIHSQSHLASRLTDHAWMVILSSKQ